ncbi:MAG: hypothetical protein DRQ88_03860 [Epsilonproteobacteria bacterium]|nr:MAG: hypothetical protein DRQ89_04165 [Campylobacterota bacterium]RLA67173.1 MAG: hypothetical protein DRQ88_03860 [Campylobacterota bacterium]
MEEEIEESIVRKKKPTKLVGRNLFLYLLLIFNTLMGLLVLGGQLRIKSTTALTGEQPFLVKSAKKVGQGEFVSFALIITNLAEYDGPRRYIRIKPIIEVTKGLQYKEISLKKKVIRNQLISYLNTLTPENVLGETGLNNLKADVKKIFKKILTHTQIKMLYFSEFRVN